MVVPIFAVDPSTLDLGDTCRNHASRSRLLPLADAAPNRRFAEFPASRRVGRFFLCATLFRGYASALRGWGLVPARGRQHRPSDRSLMAGGRVKSRARATRTASIILQLLGQRAPRQRSRPEGPGRKAARLRPGAQESVTRPAGGGRPNPPSAHLHSASWLAHYTDSVRFVRHIGTGSALRAHSITCAPEPACRL